MKNRLVININLLLTVLLSALVSHAQNGQSSNTTVKAGGTSTTQIQPTQTNDQKAFGLSLGLEMSESIAKTETSPKENILSLALVTSYRLTELVKASAKFGLYKENFGQRQTKATNGTITFAFKGFNLNESFSTTHNVAAIVPLAEETVKRDRLRTGLSLSNGLKYQSDYITLGYTILLGQNFHEYTFNADGTANIKNRLNQSIDITVPIVENLSLTTAGIYRMGWTYGGFNRYSFSFDADINYDFTKNLSVNLGTSNEGPALKANGTDSNISLYDEDTSVFSMGVSYVY